MNVRESVQSAVHRGLVVAMEYEDPSGRRTHRKVEAHGLVSTARGDYLVAWCRLRDDHRTFRMERVRAAEVTAEPILHRELDVFAVVPDRTEQAARVGPASRDWALGEIERVRDRIGATGGQASTRLLVHLVGWTRWHVTEVRGALRGRGHARPPPAEEEFRRDLAGRTPARLAADLRRCLDGLARWATALPDGAWVAPVNAAPADARRLLADCLTGWRSPLGHLTAHLAEIDNADDAATVARCPMR